MTTEPSRVEIRLDADGRLIAAVTGAVGYLATEAGLGDAPVSSLRSATASACREAFGQVKDESMPLSVAILRYADRIAVELAHRGSSGPAIGLEALAGFAEKLGSEEKNPFLTGGVDRVEYESQGDSAMTRLTKYLKPPASAA